MNTGLVAEMAFHVVGGLGIFLLGMKYMQEGLQVVAGDSIRRMINVVTSKRFLAVGIGVFITTLVQSSSVTSVMVIGLVNSELMALNGAIGVIIGANRGTTITGWMLALKIGQYGLPLLGLAAFGWLFIQEEKLRYSALAVLGIGMVFFGLELMKDGFDPISDLPEFASMFQTFGSPTESMGAIGSTKVSSLCWREGTCVAFELSRRPSVALSVWHDEATALHQGRSRQAEVHGQIYDAVLVRR